MPEATPLYLSDDTDPDTLRARCRRDILERADQLVTLQLQLPAAFALSCQLQLALRHPGNFGISAQLAHAVSATLAEFVSLTPAIQLVIEQGWKAALDDEIWRKEP